MKEENKKDWIRDLKDLTRLIEVPEDEYGKPVYEDGDKRWGFKSKELIDFISNLLTQTVEEARKETCFICHEECELGTTLATIHPSCLALYTKNEDVEKELKKQAEEIEKVVLESLEKNFPKGECKERGKALVMQAEIRIVLQKSL